jgi:hypothetical protein
VGVRNYLIEGVSCTGKTSVCTELQRRGYHAIHGDRELSYRGDPETGEPREGFAHEHHIWDVDKVKALVANHDEAVTFFCGGSRNFAKFIGLFDGVFGQPTEREVMVRLHQTREDVPKNGISIDATAPLARVVDEILRHVEREL